MMSLDNLVPAQHQAAGHDGCLTSGDGAVFAKLTTQQEIDFYNATAAVADDEEVAPGSLLSDWMPTYLGTLTPGNLAEEEAPLTAANTDKQYIVLQNLLYGFVAPSILDIKLGSVLTDDAANPEKVERLQKVSDATTSGSLGFRVCGMKLFAGETPTKPEELYPEMHKSVLVETTNDGSGDYLKFDKYFGRSLTKDTMKQGLLLYFQHAGNQNEFIVKNLIVRFHQRLQLLYNCLLSTEVRIVSGSLFFIYENHPDGWKSVDNQETYEERDPLVRSDFVASDDDDDDDDDDETTIPPLSALNLIDFAHAKHVKGQGYDENVLDGLQNLIDIFEELLDKTN